MWLNAVNSIQWGHFWFFRYKLRGVGSFLCIYSHSVRFIPLDTNKKRLNDVGKKHPKEGFTTQLEHEEEYQVDSTKPNQAQITINAAMSGPNQIPNQIPNPREFFLWSVVLLRKNVIKRINSRG